MSAINPVCHCTLCMRTNLLKWSAFCLQVRKNAIFHKGLCIRADRQTTSSATSNFATSSSCDNQLLWRPALCDDQLFATSSSCDNQLLWRPALCSWTPSKQIIVTRQMDEKFGRKKLAYKYLNHIQLDNTKRWTSQKAGRHKKLEVTKSWKSQKAGGDLGNARKKTFFFKGGIP